MENFLTLIVLAALSLISSYLNKKAEREQNEENAERLKERAAREEQRRQRQSSPEHAQRKISEPQSFEFEPAQQGAPPSETKPEPEPNPVRKFWEELNEATRELTKPFETEFGSDDSPKPHSVPNSAELQYSEQTAIDSAQIALQEARKKKQKAAAELVKKKRLSPSSKWANKSHQPVSRKLTARHWLKSPDTARQAFAAAVILAPPKALSEEDEHRW